MALQMSMGGPPPAGEEVGSTEQVSVMPKARRKGNRVKALSLIWACREFAHVYSEKNTIIVDDTLDVCSANPHHSVHCTRYFWKDHATDAELARLSKYLGRIATEPTLPQSHERWREGL